MGLEPTTPCLQIRPARTMANGYGRSDLINGGSWTVADDSERRRMRPTCSIAATGRCKGRNSRSRWRLKREMKPESFIEPRQQFRWKISNSRSDSLHCDRAHLFCLRLRVLFKASRGRAQRHLKRVDACSVRCHGNNRHHATSQPLRGVVRSVIAHDDGGSSLGRFGSDHGIEVNPTDLSAPH